MAHNPASELARMPGGKVITMSSEFNTILHGDIDELDALLDQREFTNAELRAALQNLITEVRTCKRRISDLEYVK